MAYDGTKPASGSSLSSAEIRENFRALKEDGITIPSDSSVSQAKLKTSTGEVSHSGGNVTLPGGEYGFYPLLKAQEGYNLAARLAYGFVKTTYTANILLEGGAGTTVYAKQRYVTSSLKKSPS